MSEPYEFHDEKLDASLDKFGEIIIKIFKDKQLIFLDKLFSGGKVPPEYEGIKCKLSSLDSEKQDFIRAYISHSIIISLHDMFYAIDDANDLGVDAKIIVDNVDISNKSEGLHAAVVGDGEKSWETKFSKFPSSDELEKKYNL